VEIMVALNTFTGKMACESGFSKVASIEGEMNADGTYKSVNSIKKMIKVLISPHNKLIGDLVEYYNHEKY
jgi:hypothetical protein